MSRIMIRNRHSVLAAKTRTFVRESTALVAQFISLVPHLTPRALKRKFRAGNLFSRLMREVFEIKRIKAIFGGQLAAAVVAAGIFGVSVESEFGPAYPEAVRTAEVLTIREPVVTTIEVGYQVPVEKLLGVSTRFQSGHPGIDLRAPLRSKVLPVNDGVVLTIVHGNLGYGRRVIVDHGDGMQSLYAHLGLITVDEGDVVTKDTVLGEIGLTGWSTGPHLHLEMHKNGVAVNPSAYLVFGN